MLSAIWLNGAARSVRVDPRLAHAVELSRQLLQVLRKGINPRSETGSRCVIDVVRRKSGTAPATVGERKRSHTSHCARGVNKNARRGKADRLGWLRMAHLPARKSGDRPVCGDVVSREAILDAVVSRLTIRIAASSGDDDCRTRITLLVFGAALKSPARGSAD